MKDRELLGLAKNLRDRLRIETRWDWELRGSDAEERTFLLALLGEKITELEERMDGEGVRKL